MQERKLKTLNGVVVSNSGHKIVNLTIDFKVKHPKYGKYIKRRTKIGVPDEHNQSGVGDLVEITECRPRSKTKSWRLVRIVQRAVEV